MEKLTLIALLEDCDYEPEYFNVISHHEVELGTPKSVLEALVIETYLPEANDGLEPDELRTADDFELLELRVLRVNSAGMIEEVKL